MVAAARAHVEALETELAAAEAAAGEAMEDGDEGDDEEEEGGVAAAATTVLRHEVAAAKVALATATVKPAPPKASRGDAERLRAALECSRTSCARCGWRSGYRCPPRRSPSRRRRVCCARACASATCRRGATQSPSSRRRDADAPCLSV